MEQLLIAVGYNTAYLHMTHGADTLKIQGASITGFYSMYEVILYAAIATIVCVMLYTVLGKSVGQGPEAGIDAKKGLEGLAMWNPKLVDPVEPNSPKTGLEAIADIDGDFSPAYFMDGAKAAYSMILEAFAAGDLEQLETLLTPDVYKVYDEAIKSREAEGLTQVTDLGRLKRSFIQESALEGTMARISVLYESELTSALLNSDGEVVRGDPDVLSAISEVWIFERDLKSADLNWQLADVAPSKGDALEADPTPDTSSDTSSDTSPDTSPDMASDNKSDTPTTKKPKT